MLRRGLTFLVPSLALLAALLLPPAAFSAVRLDTDMAETLTGTNKADQITGAGGNDMLKGLAGNDTYYFKENWGSDTLEDLASYKVGGKKKPGGTDTLSFRGVTSGGVNLYLVRQWGTAFNRVIGPSGERVDLGASVVENIVGTRTGDSLVGGGEENTLSTGGGIADILNDYGGWRDGASGHPGLPASSDTFRGASANTGTVAVQDWGGTGDVLDLRPLASDEVYLAAVDCGDSDEARECLQVVTGNGNGMVLVYGQFGEYGAFTASTGQQGLIEILRFADGDVRLDDDVSVSAAASGETSSSLAGKRLTERQQKLAARAPALLEAALRELDDQPEPGRLPRR